MPKFFIDPVGGYYETLSPIDAPDGHQVVPQRPDEHHDWNGQAWIKVRGKEDMIEAGATELANGFDEMQRRVLTDILGLCLPDQTRESHRRTVDALVMSNSRDVMRGQFE